MCALLSLGQHYFSLLLFSRCFDTDIPMMDDDDKRRRIDRPNRTDRLSHHCFAFRWDGDGGSSSSGGGSGNSSIPTIRSNHWIRCIIIWSFGLLFCQQQWLREWWCRYYDAELSKIDVAGVVVELFLSIIKEVFCMEETIVEVVTIRGWIYIVGLLLILLLLVLTCICYSWMT